MLEKADIEAGIKGMLVPCRRYSFPGSYDLMVVPRRSNLPCVCVTGDQHVLVSRKAAAADLRESRMIDRMPKQDEHA